MIRFFSIKNKLILIIVLTVFISVGAGLTLDVLYESRQLEKELVDNSVLNAKLIGEYARASLLTKDAEQASESLKKLVALPDLRYGAIYDAERERFASFSKHGEFVYKKYPRFWKKTEYEFKSDYLHVTQPVKSEGETLGWVYAVSSRASINEKMNAHVFFIGIIMAIVIAITFLLASFLQRIISRPILNLAKIAERISKEGDFSARATRSSNDEIGYLYDGFNKMLKQIQLREKQRDEAEADLRDSREKYMTLFENSPDAILLMKNAIIDCNEQAEKLFGCSREEIIGSTPSNFSPLKQPNGENSVVASKEKIREGLLGKRQNYFWRHQRVDGELVDAEVVMQPLVVGGRKVLHLIIRDVTDRKKAEAALEESEQIFRGFFEYGPIGMVIMNPYTNEWIKVNQYVYNILEYTPEEFDKLTWQDITYPEDYDKEKRNMAKVFSGATDRFLIEKRYVKGDGEVIYCEFFVGCLRNQDGKVKYILALIQDVGARKRAENEIKKAGAYLASVLDSMPSSIIAVDKRGVVNHWNKAAEEETGVLFANAAGKILSEVYAHYSIIENSVTRAFEGGGPVHLEKERVVERNSHRFKSILVYPLASEKVDGVVIKIDDITEKVRLEEIMIQTEKMMSVGGLAAGMAHEINNPLGVILQGAQNAIRRLSPDLPANVEAASALGLDLDALSEYLQKRNIVKYLEGIKSAGGRAAEIVSNMLDFSRRSESKMEFADINKLVDNSLELAANDYDLKKKYDFRHIRIEKDYDFTLTGAFCIKTQIEQVLLNIFKNSAQAARENNNEDFQPELRISTRNEGEYAAIFVKDNGPGMDKETKKHIFEPFYTTKPVGEGTGLGLSVSYFIITTNHNGTISVESEPGAGAAFAIRIPIKHIS